MHVRPRFPGAVFGFAACWLAVVDVCPATDAGSTAGDVFSSQVLPILSRSCFRCHGPDDGARRGGLRLDVRERATASLPSGATPIVPHQPKASALLQRVTSDDPQQRMPPASSGDRLTDDQIQTLREWIAEGAEYQRHWAFVPATRRPLPARVSRPDWVNSPVDRFVLSRLDRAGIEPSREADRHVLIRRVTLDLTGLPPTIEDTDEFVRDTHPDAYERVVDRLLASPAVGERWARVWLDLARYADSAGYAQDPPRTIWRYRDWVIDAINANMPFDQFTIEQLAGDLLENAREDQLIATAFHRNTMTNSEGGTDDEEFRVAAVVDRVNTTMEVWMGLTMACAQCHSHKYDPISQEEYFRFFAILNNTQDADRGDEAPTLVTWTAAQSSQRQQLTAQIRELEEKLAAANETARAEADLRDRRGPLKTRYVRIELPGKRVFLSLAEVQAFAAGGTNVALQGEATQISVAFGGPARLAIDGNTDGDYQTAKSTTHTAQENDPWWEVDLGSGQPLERVVVHNRTDGGTAERLNNFRVVLLDAKRRPLLARTVSAVPLPSVAVVLPRTAGELSEQDRSTVAEYARTHSKEILAIQEQLSGLQQRLERIRGVTTPIFRELPAEKSRQTHVHVRGNFRNPGQRVAAGVPAAFHPMRHTGEPSRLDLAKWLVDPQNPLTARVVVNRFWQQLMGAGLVETSEDFGTQGAAPSHPALLDYLALELIRSGWDTKQLIRQIVTSATYRQDSRVREDLDQRDPLNRLLARGPRFRLSAEMLRDQALAIGGLLSRKMYGPSVQPPQPKLGLRAAFGGSTDWDPSPGEDRYRRGLYTKWRRTSPYPSMITFDAPSREFCTVRRIRTNTPLQALVTLNDPVFVDAAQALARRIVAEGGNTLEQRAVFAFRSCLSRTPSDAELEQIVALYQRAHDHYQQDVDAARDLATKPLGPAHRKDVAQLASWTLVSNALLNLDETLARR